jgi:hypothetical protein
VKFATLPEGGPMSDDQQPPEVDEPPANPMTGMVATGEAQIIRNGQVVTDEPGETDEENAR